MAFFASLRLKEFGFSSSRQSSTSSSTTSLCSRHSRNSTICRDSKIKPIKMEGLMEIMLKPVQTYKLPVKKKSVNDVSNLLVDLIAILLKKYSKFNWDKNWNVLLIPSCIWPFLRQEIPFDTRQPRFFTQYTVRTVNEVLEGLIIHLGLGVAKRTSIVVQTVTVHPSDVNEIYPSTRISRNILGFYPS